MPKQSMTVYEVLDMVRTRPPMYLGDYRIRSLQNLIAGMGWAGAEDGGNPIKDFTRWYCLVAGIQSSGPWTELELELGEREALEVFFSYLDRFRACILTPIETSTGPLHLRWTVAPMPPVPAYLCISQYTPTEAFILRELSEVGDDLNERFASECFVSASAAREHALSKWAAPLASWRRPS